MSMWPWNWTYNTILQSGCEYVLYCKALLTHIKYLKPKRKKSHSSFQVIHSKLCLPKLYSFPWTQKKLSNNTVPWKDIHLSLCFVRLQSGTKILYMFLQEYLNHLPQEVMYKCLCIMSVNFAHSRWMCKIYINYD